MENLFTVEVVRILLASVFCTFAGAAITYFSLRQRSHGEDVLNGPVCLVDHLAPNVVYHMDWGQPDGSGNGAVIMVSEAKRPKKRLLAWASDDRLPGINENFVVVGKSLVRVVVDE